MNEVQNSYIVNSLNAQNIDRKKVQQMIFLYSAINEGWTVKKLANNKYEFKNPSSKVKKQFFLENFLDKFIDKNYSIDTIIKNLYSHSN